MQQKPSELAAFDPTPWKAQGMDNVVIGKVWDDGKGGFVVRFFLVDSLSGKQIIAYDYPVRDLSQSRYAAHWIADKIYEQLLGVPGYFNTKIRSEEHTSELQSLMRISYAVFCLKKKNKLINNHL